MSRTAFSAGAHAATSTASLQRIPIDPARMRLQDAHSGSSSILGRTAESDRVIYEDALSTLAKVAIAIAGFSGIVSVFGRRSVGHGSVAERNRLS